MTAIILTKNLSLLVKLLYHTSTFTNEYSFQNFNLHKLIDVSSKCYSKNQFEHNFL